MLWYGIVREAEMHGGTEMTTFSERLREAMDLRQMKAVDLSDSSGVGKSDISNYMKGKYKAKQDKLYMLARSLDVSEAWLMGLDVPMKRIASDQVTETAQLTAEEMHLINIYRLAERTARAYAVEILEAHQVDENSSIRAAIAASEQSSENEKRRTR